MKVYEAEQFIKNIDYTIDAINKITAFDHGSDKVEAVLTEAGVDKSWKFIAQNGVNTLCAYKNILKDRIKNAELSDM